MRGRVWIAADVHLGPDSPATSAAFLQFVQEAAGRTDALILAGDIFDAWIGDDVALRDPEPWLRSTITALQHVSSRIPLWLGRGNRDFLVGERLAELLGARLLPETVLLETDAGPILLAHGDEYCTADPHYQRFRSFVRNRSVQRIYLALPLSLRKRIAAWARERSMRSNRYKTPDIMDVESSAVAQALRHSNASTLIHGHTHRPGRHALSVDGHSCERLVLPDWDFDHTGTPRGGWIAIDADGPRIVMHGPSGFTPEAASVAPLPAS